jgi:hypothetical protein
MLKDEKIRPCDLNYVSESWNMQLNVLVCVQMQVQPVLCYSYTYDMIFII